MFQNIRSSYLFDDDLRHWHSTVSSTKFLASGRHTCGWHTTNAFVGPANSVCHRGAVGFIGTFKTHNREALNFFRQIQ